MVNKSGRNTWKEGGGKDVGVRKETKSTLRELGLTCEEVNIKEKETTHAGTSGFKQLTVRESLELRR